MRLLPLCAALMVAASPLPAMAQDAAPPADTTTLSQAAEQLGDPALQDAAAVTLSTMLDALLDLPIAPLVNAVSDVHPDADLPKVEDTATLRQYAGPAGDEMPETIRNELPRAMDMMSGMAAGFEAMLPALRDMAAQLEGAVEDAVQDAR